MPLAKDLLHPPPPRGEEKAQVEEAPAPQLLLHGRQVPRLLQVQMPFCVSVSPLWRLQRQKGLKLVRLSGELGSVTQFHIAKLAHTQF